MKLLIRPFSELFNTTQYAVITDTRTEIIPTKTRRKNDEGRIFIMIIGTITTKIENNGLIR